MGASAVLCVRRPWLRLWLAVLLFPSRAGRVPLLLAFPFQRLANEPALAFPGSGWADISFLARESWSRLCGFVQAAREPRVVSRIVSLHSLH